VGNKGVKNSGKSVAELEAHIRELERYIIEIEHDIAVERVKDVYRSNDPIVIGYAAKISGRPTQRPSKPKGYREPHTRPRPDLLFFKRYG
jgi:hypothetical protein